MGKRRVLTAGLILQLILTGLVLSGPGRAIAASTTVVVTPATLAATGWLIQHDNCDPPAAATGSTTFVNGPNTPPLGGGSAQFTTGSSATAFEGLRNGNYNGTPIAQISALSYSTIVTAGTLSDVPYLSLAIDFNNGDDPIDEVLNFEPVYQTGSYPPAPATPTPAQNGGTIQANQWQTWNVLTGALRQNLAPYQPVPNTTWPQFVAAHPGATLRNSELGGGIRIFAGCGGASANLTAATDNVTVGVNGNDTVFDFELGTDLAISKVAQPDPVTAGSNVTYTINVVNNGPGNAPSTVVTDVLPAGTTYVSCAASGGGVCGGAGNSRTVTFSSFAAGANATIILIASVGGAVANGAVLSNTASVTSSAGETNPGNNSSTASIVVSNPPAASPSPSPTTYTVTASATGPGNIAPVGTTSYTAGSLATYTASPTGTAVFLGWTLDNQYVGYASPLTFTVNGNRTLVAQFAARPSFGDVPTSDPDYQAISFLAAAGIINPNGVNGTGQFQPDRDVKRAEVAAFVARVFGWNKEFHANNFPDKCDPNGLEGCVDDELWNNVAALADYGVVGGYTDPATCQAGGTTAPCYLPRDVVKRVQVVSIVARSFIKTPDLRPTGFWDRLDANASQYTNVPNTGTQRSDLTTYLANVGSIPDQAGTATFNGPEGNGKRRFVIEVLYAAFNAQYGVDRVP